MKRIAILLCLAAAAVLTGCGLFPVVRGSGVPASVSFDLGAFTKVAATQACTLRFVHDTAASIIVTVDDNLVPYLDVRQNGSEAVLVGLKQGYMYMGATFIAEVHASSLESLDLSGASDAIVPSGLGGAFPLSVTLSGASKADLQGVSYPALDADISGGSSLTAAGSAGTGTLVLSGGSQARLLDCRIGAAHVNLSGGSECWIQIGSGSVDLAASGGSVLYYRGAPSLGSMDLSGGSRIVSVP